MSSSSKRTRCCNASWFLFCPLCCSPLKDAQHPDFITLPLDLHMYRHPGEKVSKSTSVHAKVVAPLSTTLFVEDCSGLRENKDGVLTSRYPDPKRVLLLFPSKDAKPLSQLPRSSFDKLIVLDGTWTQAKSMYNCLKDVGFQPVTIEFPMAPSLNSTVVESSSSSNYIESSSSSTSTVSLSSTASSSSTTALEPVKTMFWRYQSLGEHCLATIEAVYYFYRDYFAVYEEKDVGAYDGRFDALLYYFKIQYEAVQQNYRDHPEKEFTKKKANSEKYIKR
ncbi:hypothetical protein BDR26DRAFT_1010689 [Obelidium mucronatum]|nr:hypothetical protein BDR26DRAFT_1010689 [Obelidium mucronatum]